MFTKDDYGEYFAAIKNKEEGMVKHLAGALPSVKDAKVSDMLNHVLKDEIEHCKLADELFKCL